MKRIDRRRTRRRTRASQIGKALLDCVSFKRSLDRTRLADLTSPVNGLIMGVAKAAAAVVYRE